MKNYLDNLPNPFLILAPLDDVTDTVFRQVVGSCAAPDLYFTEFTNVDALQSPGRENTLRRLQFTEKERPLIAQIWGKQPENFYKTAKELVEMGFDGIDLNMGCPDKAVVKNGCGGGLIENKKLAQEIIKATQEGAANQIPVSVKTRIGFKDFDKEWLELLFSQKLNMLSVHLRTVKELSLVPAHWEIMDVIRHMRDSISPDTALVGNGDIESRLQAEELVKKYGIDGAMIGRGVFHDPYVFAKNSPWDSFGPEQKIELYEKHVSLFAQTWQNQERRVHVLNKFCKIYINGFNGAKELREKLMRANDTDELLSLLSAAKQDISRPT